MNVTLFDRGRRFQQAMMIVAACVCVAGGVLFLGIPARPGHLPRPVVGGLWLLAGAVWFFRYWMSRARASQQK